MKNNEQSFFVQPSEIQLSAHQVESARAIFELFDVNKSGDISREELASAFQNFGKDLSDGELDAFFSQYDTDNSNSIDFEEYLKVVQYQFAKISTTLAENVTFKGKFTPEEFKVILEFISIKSYKKDEKIQQIGEPSRAACVILYGDVQMSCEQGSGVNSVVGTNHIFGMSAFTESGSQASCVTALSDVVLAIFDIENLEMLLLRDSNLYRKLKDAFNINASDDEKTPPTKYVAVLAHNNVKKIMLSFVEKNFDFFSKAPIIGTLSTGSILFQKLGISLSKKVASGPLGGDQAIGSLIEPGQLAGVFFFRDPLSPHPHQADIEALCRLCDVYQVPFATNTNTADALVMYLKHHGLNKNQSSDSSIVDQYFMAQSDALQKM